MKTTDLRRITHQIGVVVRAAPQNVGEELLASVAGFEIASDAVADHEVDQRLVLLALLHREQFDHLKRRRQSELNHI